MYGNCACDLSGAARTCSNVDAPCVLPPPAVRAAVSLPPLSHLFPYSQLVGGKWQLTEALTCISLLVNDAERLSWASRLLWRNVSPIPSPALVFTVAAKAALHLRLTLSLNTGTYCSVLRLFHSNSFLHRLLKSLSSPIPLTEIFHNSKATLLCNTTSTTRPAWPLTEPPPVCPHSLTQLAQEGAFSSDCFVTRQIKTQLSSTLEQL